TVALGAFVPSVKNAIELLLPTMLSVTTTLGNGVPLSVVTAACIGLPFESASGALLVPLAIGFTNARVTRCMSITTLGLSSLAPPPTAPSLNAAWAVLGATRFAACRASEARNRELRVDAAAKAGGVLQASGWSGRIALMCCTRSVGVTSRLHTPIVSGDENARTPDAMVGMVRSSNELPTSGSFVRKSVIRDP